MAVAQASPMIESKIRKEVEHQAHKMFERIYSSFSMSKFSTVMIFLERFFSNSYKKIIVNDKQIKKLQALMTRRKGPIIFCPTHRSYVDFLVLSTILYYHEMEPPLICAGEDFLGMKVVGDLLRGSGAFFMRRTFRGDELYKSIFYEYV